MEVRQDVAATAGINMVVVVQYSAAEVLYDADAEVVHDAGEEVGQDDDAEVKQ